MLDKNLLIQSTLDNGQVINDKLNNLSREQIISVANQYYRARHTSFANALMLYQHNKFSTKSPRKI